MIEYAKSDNIRSKIQKNTKKKSMFEYYNPHKKSNDHDETGVDPVCKICLVNTIDVICVPCKHAWICNDYYKDYKLKNDKCELCKQKIEYIVDFNIC